MKPGATMSSSASMVRCAPPAILPISAIVPFLIPTSARRRGAPVPSTTVPFLTIRSYVIEGSPFLARSEGLSSCIEQPEFGASREIDIPWAEPPVVICGEISPARRRIHPPADGGLDVHRFRRDDVSDRLRDPADRTGARGRGTRPGLALLSRAYAHPDQPA